MKQQIALSFLRVTEAAACAASSWVGVGDGVSADKAAVDAMRYSFNVMSIAGKIVIGEGERDEAPMLYIGERVGLGWTSSAFPKFDLAVDPLEGTNLCANGLPGAISVIAISEEGNLLNAPDTYMDKLIVGSRARHAIDIRKSPSWNLSAIAEAKHKKVDELSVIILDRPRHRNLIEEVRKAGARVHLISDGDVAASISVCLPNSKLDALMGIGGAPEGVISATAVRCLGGEMQGKLVYRDNNERSRAESMGIFEHEHTYKAEELARGNVSFVASGVTKGDLLDGTLIKDNGIEVHSLLMESEPKAVHFIRSFYPNIKSLHLGPK